jgi:hypothetical protein
MAVTWEKIAYEGDVVTKALFDADTFLYAASDNTPVATSPANVLAALSGHAAAEFLFNTQKVGGVVDPTAAQQAATKAYVDAQVAAVNEFTELTDTPADYSGDADKFVVVNSVPDALVFITAAVAASRMALDDIGVPDAPVDFDLQQATDLVLMTVANEAALPTTNIAVGQVAFATAELTAHICTAIA